jgi:uncharacterized protein (TIGR01244 family)
MQVRKILSLLILSSLSTLVSAENQTAHPKKLALAGFQSGIYQTDKLFIAGQPLSSVGIKELKRLGLTTIVNIRTAQEVTNPKLTPIDESALSTELGLKYVHLPSGGKGTPYNPATVRAFARVMDAASGKVLLHCASGRRASHLWVAYLVNYQDVPLATAIDLGREANFGSVPLEGYLKGSINYLLTN